MPIIGSSQIVPPDPHGEAPKLAFDTASLQLVESIAVNVRQELIVVTRDKVELWMHQHLKAMEGRSAWLAPFGITLTIMLTLLTADFKDKGFKKETWQAFFLIGAVLSSVWLIRSLFSIRPRHSVDDVITELKASQAGGRPQTPPASGWRRLCDFVRL